MYDLLTISKETLVPGRAIEDITLGQYIVEMCLLVSVTMSCLLWSGLCLPDDVLSWTIMKRFAEDQPLGRCNTYSSEPLYVMII